MKFVDALKREGSGTENIISKHTQRAQDLQTKKGELQLYEKWLELFGTGKAESLYKTEESLLDFIKRNKL